MTRGRKAKIDDIDNDEEKILEGFRGRERICTCESDPGYCDIHDFE